jgi:hypothetical protein
MKIHVENAETLELLTPSGDWTTNINKAAIYSNSTTAKHAGAAAPIGKFNVIGTFRNFPQITNLDEGCGTGHARSARA